MNVRTSVHLVLISNQVDQISENHFELTKALVEQSLTLSSDLVNYLTEFANVLHRHPIKGQKEMCDLSRQLSELANYMER